MEVNDFESVEFQCVETTSDEISVWFLSNGKVRISELEMIKKEKL